MSDYLLRCTVMYNMDKLNHDVRLHIDRLALPVELRGLIAHYTDFHIDDYVDIASKNYVYIDHPWLDGSDRSRWSHIIVDCRYIITRGVVTIQHSHHQMSVTKLNLRSIDIEFNIICEAISTCDYSTIEKLIIQDDKTLSDSGLSPAWIKICTVDAIKRIICRFS